ncbi:MAG: kinesin, partial [Myxococcales bacterium]
MNRLVFRRYGGSTQLQMKSFADLEQALEVPEALWVATACPTTGLSCDRRFLEFLDSDGNKRVRADELKAAVRWTRSMLRDTAGCDEGSEVLVLDRLTEAAAPLKHGAELVLRVLGGDESRLSLTQLRDSAATRRDTGVNGDGIVAPSHLTD